MGQIVIDGKLYAKEVEENLKQRVAKIVEKTGVVPTLATIIVGNNPASVTYVRMKCKACLRIGLQSRKIELPESTTTQELLSEIEKLNADPSVCGILLQHPVPRQIDELKCFDAISLEKDVDGVNTASFGKMTMGQDAYFSATPFAICSLLKRYGIEVAGKHAVVIGRSQILGKPVAMMLLNMNATVTICHSRTKNLEEICKTADIIVACVGKAKFVKESFLKDGVVIVDAGYNEGNVGDVDLENCIKKCSAYTPVPGGVGPVTICKLMEQTVIASERRFLEGKIDG